MLRATDLCPLVGVFAAALLATPIQAQTRVPFGWNNSTELSYVSTGGNASSSSFGLKGTIAGTDSINSVKFEVGGIHSETEVTTRVAIGTPGDFDVAESVISEVTAENYRVRGRYDRELQHAFAFAGAGWARNTFAGVQNRWAFVAGLGRTLIQAGDAGYLKADVGATYTIQKDVEPVPGADDSFGGLRLSAEGSREISASADFTSEMLIDENLEDTQDLRIDWVNSVTLALSERLAFKTSLQIMYDHQPSNLRIDLVDVGGQPTGSTVLTPTAKLDHITTLTLVIRL